MAAGMKVYLAPDSDLRAFGGAPKTLQLWLRTRPQPPLELGPSWQMLSDIIGALPDAPRAPLAAEGADYRYQGAADHGAHGLSSPATERLSAAVARVDLAAVERGLAGSGADGNSAEAARLLQLLAALREVCERAVTKRYGLVLALWEEP